VIIAFVIGALMLSTLLSTVTYSVTRARLTESREQAALISAQEHAIDINAELDADSDISDLVPAMLDVIVPEGTSQGMLYNSVSQWVDVSVLTENRLDPEFVRTLRAGSAAVMTVEIDEVLHHVVGLPIPRLQANASYIQAVKLTEVEDDLNSLTLTLVGASAITAMLGMGFGVWVSKRLLAPVHRISEAAGLVADGDLSTRLKSAGDPDLDQLIMSFNGMTGSLQERIERDSRFASDVSHELRSPLMTLTGSVAVLERRRDDMPERAQLALDLLSTDIKRFKLLVEDLLEISRFDVGAVQLDIEEVMFGEFVRQAIGAAVARERDVPIIHGEGIDELFVELDKRRIAQVIRNLSENADKYAGGVTQIRLEHDGDDVRIELEDEGPGVPVDERELIFERFARGSEGGRRGSGTGVGLGLSLVTEHLRLHGGTVSVADRVDGLLGARFIISLPGVVVE